MTLKNLYISTGVLAVLAVITYFINKPSPEPKQDPRVGEAIVSQEVLRSANQIEFSSDGETVTIANRVEDKQWTVKERSSMPVDFSRLSSQIGNFLDGKLQKLVSTNPERIATFGFDSGESVRFFDADGASLAEIELGKDAEGGRQFLRFKGEEKAFLITNSISLTIDPDSWLNKKLVELVTNEIASLETTLSNGETLSAARFADAENAPWTSDTVPEGKVLNESEINSLISRLTGLSFTDTNTPDAEEVIDAKANSHQFILTTKEGASYTYGIGRRPEIKVEKEVQRTDDEGNTTTAMEEIVEQEEGPVFLFVKSSDADDPINGYSKELAFEIASYQFTNLPTSIDELLKDAPEPEIEEAELSSEEK